MKDAHVCGHARGAARLGRSQVEHLRCIDLSHNHLAAGWMRRHGVRLYKENESIGDFDLVICESAELARARSMLSPDGLLLVHSGEHEKLDTHLLEFKLRRLARVRGKGSQWQLVTADPPSPDPGFLVSVVITCRDQARPLARALTMMAADDSGVRWELIVVDRGSFDESSALLRALSGDLQVLRRPRDWPISHAIDTGLIHARGSLAIVLDPTLVPDTNWLREAGHLASNLEKAGPRLFAGTIVDEKGDKDDSATPPPPCISSRFFAISVADYRRSRFFHEGEALEPALEKLDRELGTLLCPSFMARTPTADSVLWQNAG